MAKEARVKSTLGSGHCRAVHILVYLYYYKIILIKIKSRVPSFLQIFGVTCKLQIPFVSISDRI